MGVYRKSLDEPEATEEYDEDGWAEAVQIGESVVWRSRLPGEYYSSPVAADGKVFMLSASGKATVLKAGAQWDILAVNDLSEECWATPAIAGDSLYIRTRNSLYSFSLAVK